MPMKTDGLYISPVHETLMRLEASRWCVDTVNLYARQRDRLSRSRNSPRIWRFLDFYPADCAFGVSVRVQMLQRPNADAERYLQRMKEFMVSAGGVFAWAEKRRTFEFSWVYEYGKTSEGSHDTKLFPQVMRQLEFARQIERSCQSVLISFEEGIKLEAPWRWGGVNLDGLIAFTTQPPTNVFH